MTTNKLLTRYFLEFIVIVLGISISFYIEKRNLNAYNEKLKNISLEKIYQNLSQDLEDLEYNKSVHEDLVFSGNQIIHRGEYLFKNKKDSLGYHLSLVSTGLTFFLDNKEEYSGMKNSGLIELIENQDLVASLQTRYAETKIFKVFDDLFLRLYMQLKTLTFRQISNERKAFPKFYGPLTHGAYIGDAPINEEVINYIIEKTGFHQFYVQIMESRIEEDRKILKLIEKELNRKEIETESNSWSDLVY